MASNPHLAGEAVRAGQALDRARAAAVVVHGRGQGPDLMLDHLVARLDLADVAYVLPAAAGHTWYPERFNAELAANEPSLSHALEALEAALDQTERAGVPRERTVLVGFSQGGCLAAELVLRRPRALQGLAVLTGAAIGPPDQPRQPPDLTGLTAFFGASDRDAWVPWPDVQRTADVYAAGGAHVTLRRYHDSDHAIYDDEVAHVRALLARPPTA